MRRGSARIRTPSVLERFRHRYIEFDEAAHLALETATGDIQSVVEWLSREQLPYWNAQFRRFDDLVKETWREYVNARYGDRRMGKPSCIDERKAWELAKRRKQEAEAKIRIVTAWIRIIDHEVERLKPAMVRFDSLLSSATPRAIGRLDVMLTSLHEYLQSSARGPSVGTATGTGGNSEENGDAADQQPGTDADDGTERSGS